MAVENSLVTAEWSRTRKFGIASSVALDGNGAHMVTAGQG